MIGIYKITSPSGKIYIGQSINIESRKKLYSKSICKGQKKLYNSIIKYGWNKHIFDVVCECEINELNDKERFYQELYSVIGIMGLNLKLTKSNDKICKVSEETKRKISTSNKIKNAKKRGDFDENQDYSLLYKIKKTKNKTRNKTEIFFPITKEIFISGMDLFRKHKEYFYSYGSMMYDLKKKGKIIIKKQIEIKKNEKTENNCNLFSSCGDVG